uniref:Uncharacterized protein n=1 Tax=Aegilops tauschii subsp. strangulata TaxID=200361 RepID=A0A453EBA8_AEGTS
MVACLLSLPVSMNHCLWISITSLFYCNWITRRPFSSWFLFGQVCGPPGMMNHISGDKAKDYSQGEVMRMLFSH